MNDGLIINNFEDSRYRHFSKVKGWFISGYRIHTLTLQRSQITVDNNLLKIKIIKTSTCNMTVF